MIMRRQAVVMPSAPLRPRSEASRQAERVQQHTAQKQPDSKLTLKVIPLGGIEEVGENMTVLEYGDDILVIDAGIGFPDETMPGIDYIIPNTKYLEDNKKKIRGMIITHGHLDHIGAIPYIMPKIGDPPIYTMKLTGEFIKKRLEEFHLLGRSTIHEVNKDDVLTLGNFRIRFFRLNHNIPASGWPSTLQPDFWFTPRTGNLTTRP